MALTIRAIDDILSDLAKITLSDEDRMRIIDIIAVPKPKCRFLEELPLETRERIYGYLLLNPEFGDPDFCEDFSPLSTSILGTCKQIHAEADRVLCQKNTFVTGFGIYRKSSLREERIWSRGYAISLSQKESASTMSFCDKIKRWRVVFDFMRRGCEDQRAIKLFCHRIFNCKLHSLEVLVNLPRKKTGLGIPQTTLKELLEPLRSLRNVRNFSIKARTDNGQIDNTTEFQGDIEALETEMRKIVTGNTPRDDTLAIHNALVRYIAAFETHGTMQAKVEELYYSCAIWPRFFEFEASIFEERRGYNSLLDTYDPQTQFLALFNRYHPVGRAIHASKTALLEDGQFDFGGARREILQLLEPRYQGIVEASVAMAEHIKYMKRERLHHLDHPDPTKQLMVFAEALLHLEKFAHALGVGNMPRQIQIRCKMDKKLAYLSGYGEYLVKRLVKDFENGDVYELPMRFRDVVDHLNARYLAIREARKKLYEGDALAPVSGIGVGEVPQLCDEMVDWDAGEPLYGPWYHDGDLF
ncbi:hypothetical protein HYFRA_00002905 [Hymenoscyphus fraxineus]|uniref:Uncharacterized protein n=1 Tax=Hymenoscyphus fraxineus TaxID=746836 RepID=A0A9N9KMT5_9HELO|nr:hypothetical protein HYFRA_00002905 [Hymenoscyphus fraxineus]